jgi:hypothetical protein
MRIIIGIILFISVIQGWWFIAVPLCLYGSWRYPLYLETLMAGIAYDSLFGYNHPAGLQGYLGTAVAAGIVILILILKKVMR